MTHHTRTLATVVALLLLTIQVPFPPSGVRGAEGPAPKPNIVIMLVDDMGVMDTSVPFLMDADGKPKRYPLNEFYRTPNIRPPDVGPRTPAYSWLSCQ